MSYQEAERVRLKQRFSKQAIALAMQGRWQEAVTANKSLIENFPSDVGAHNRLGKAYTELGEYAQARRAYGRAIELDPNSAIAEKNLRRLSHLGEAMAGSEGDAHKAEPQHFIEEIGRAGVVDLYHLAPPEILAKTATGDKVYLKVDESSLIVENSHGEYLGQVEPKHGRRLAKLMEVGNKYIAAIISSTEETVTVIIREADQDPNQAGRLSFLPKRFEDFRPYVDDRIIRRELEREEALPEEPGYTIIGGDEGEVLPRETLDMNDNVDSEE